MKKLFLLLALVAMFASGCEKDSDDSGTNNPTEQPGDNGNGGNNDNGDNNGDDDGNGGDNGDDNGDGNNDDNNGGDDVNDDDGNGGDNGNSSNDDDGNNGGNNPSGLPKPKANEIYYTTTDGVALDLGGKGFYSTVSSHSIKNGNIFVLTFMQDLSLISESIEISFEDAKRLQTIRLPEGFQKIRNNTFYDCRSLASITIPNSVTSIGAYAFFYCESLINITIPEGVTSIGYGAFKLCRSLTSITIPEGVTSIGEMAFSDCRSLEQVYCKPITPPEALRSGHYAYWDAFSTNAEGRKIYVPRESVEAYKSAEGWDDWEEDYANAIVGYDF